MVLSIKKNIFKALLIILFGFVASADAIAAVKYWVAANDGTEKVWHNSANWSTQSGGSGGAGTPNSKADSAVFDSNSTVNVKLSKNVKKLYKLKVLNGYSGTINLNGKKLSEKDIDAFKIMGLELNASWPIIQKKFKTLVKRFHPDKNSGNKQFEDKLKRITLAYSHIKMIMINKY